MSVSVGTAIYISVKPLFKIFLNCALGFVLARKQIFTVQTCQHISLLIINFLIPCLVFYNVVSCLDGSQIKVIGIIALTAVLYTIIGLVFGVIVRLTTPNPRTWFGGVIAACAFNNSSDLPIAYVTSLASSSLFPPSAARQGTAYSVIFMVVFILSVFNFGGMDLIAHDFKGKSGDTENQSQVEVSDTVSFRDTLVWIKSMFERRANRIPPPTDTHGLQPQSSVAISVTSATSAHPPPRPYTAEDRQGNDEKLQQPSKAFEIPQPISDVRMRSQSMSISPTSATTSRLVSRRRPSSIKRDTNLTGAGSFVVDPNALTRSETVDDVIMSFNKTQRRQDEAVSEMDALRQVMSASPRVHASGRSQGCEKYDEDACSCDESTQSNLPGMSAFKRFTRRPFVHRLIYFAKDFFRPPSTALVVSLVVCMVPQLRRLFYTDPTVTDPKTYGIPEAPDGEPILDFVMDFTQFVGNACVPLGLSMLGATIARLEVKQLPKGFWKSILLTCVFKLVVLPIIAVLWVEKLQSIGWLDKDDIMAVFVMIITSGVPTATSQLYITAMFSPPDQHIEMDCLAAYLIAQYSVLLVSLSLLVTYTLKNVVSL